MNGDFPCTLVYQELKISPKSLPNMLGFFPFVSNFGCSYRYIIEIEITIFNHW